MKWTEEFGGCWISDEAASVLNSLRSHAHLSAVAEDSRVESAIQRLSAYAESHLKKGHRKIRLAKLRAPVAIDLEGELPSFSAVAYSGGLVPGYTATPELPLPYVIDLSHTKLHRHIVANLDHKSDQRVGHVTEAINDKKQLRVKGLFSAVTPFRDEVVGGARNGQPWEVSQEGELGKFVLVQAGETVSINGQSFSGPFYVARQSRVTGIAFVSQGADEGNSVDIAASLKLLEEICP